MPLLEKAQGIFFGNDIKGPIFDKDFEEKNNNLERLIELSNKIHGEKKDEIEMEILFMRQGVAGEGNVCFELKNSFIPMLCLHDVRIEHNGLVAHQKIYLRSRNKKIKRRY